MHKETICNMWNGTMFVDLDRPLNASSLSASAELLVSTTSLDNLSNVEGRSGNNTLSVYICWEICRSGWCMQWNIKPTNQAVLAYSILFGIVHWRYCAGNTDACRGLSELVTQPHVWRSWTRNRSCTLCKSKNKSLIIFTFYFCSYTLVYTATVRLAFKSWELCIYSLNTVK